METILSFKKSTDGDSVYPHICAFADFGYRRRYDIGLEVFPEMFIYATDPKGEIVACFGASWGSNHPTLTTEWYVCPQALATYVSGPITASSRSKLYEIGTRVVNLPPGSGTNSVRTSVAMTAVLLLHLYKEGGRFSLFTGDRSVHIITRQLRADVMRFGTPDLSRRDDSYVKHWQAYFDVPRECFGLDLKQAADGCYAVCDQLSQSGFVFEPGLFSPMPETRAISI